MRRRTASHCGERGRKRVHGMRNAAVDPGMSASASDRHAQPSRSNRAVHYPADARTIDSNECGGSDVARIQMLDAAQITRAFFADRADEMDGAMRTQLR